MTLFRLRNICFSYQGTPVLENIEACVSQGSRVGIIGPNGCGKSTLLKIITGEISPGEGHIEWAKMPRLGYVPQVFPQVPAGMVPGIVPGNGLGRGPAGVAVAESGSNGYGCKSNSGENGKKAGTEFGTEESGAEKAGAGGSRAQQDARTPAEGTPLGLIGSEHSGHLGRFGIGRHLWDKPLSVLSGGEKTRLLLARAFSVNPGLLVLDEPTNLALTCLTFAPYDLLLMDEPTNHLDVIAREAIEEALAAFPGAIIVATHDRFLIERFCTCMWYLNQGNLHLYHGSYTQFQKWMDARNEKSRAYSGRPGGTGQDYQRTPGDRKARELAVRTRLAYIVSQLSTADDVAERMNLEAQYQDAVAELKRLDKEE